MEIQNKYNIHLVSFNLKNSDEQNIYKYTIKGDTPDEIKLNCSVYLDPGFKNKTVDYSTYYFYLSIRSITNSNDSPIQYQMLQLDRAKLLKNQFVRLNFSFFAPLQLTDDLISTEQMVGIQLSCSMASISNPNFYTEFDEGLFLDTAIPVEVINDEQ